MKEFYMIWVAVLTKQAGPLNYAEELSFVFASLPKAEIFVEHAKALNEKWTPHFGEEPICLMETRMVWVPDTWGEAYAVLQDRLENGEKHFAEFVGLAPVDTDSELERIRKGSKS